MLRICRRQEVRKALEGTYIYTYLGIELQGNLMAVYLLPTT